MKMVAAVVSGILFLAMEGMVWANEGPNTRPSDGFYLSFKPSLVCPFSVETTSPGLSPGKAGTRWGLGVDAGLGYRYRDFRIEGELTYERSQTDDIRFYGGGGDLSGYYDMWGGIFSLSYDIPTGTRLRPYVGTGLGVMRFKAHDITLADFPPTRGSNTLAAYRLMAGISFAITDTYHLLLGYRFTGTGRQDYETGGTPLRGDSLMIHALQMGFRFHF